MSQDGFTLTRAQMISILSLCKASSVASYLNPTENDLAVLGYLAYEVEYRTCHKAIGDIAQLKDLEDHAKTKFATHHRAHRIRAQMRVLHDSCNTKALRAVEARTSSFLIRCAFSEPDEELLKSAEEALKKALETMKQTVERIEATGKGTKRTSDEISKD